MISVELGKRYERLLFFTAPISLAAIIICFVAIASSTQKERVDARCYTKAYQIFLGKSKQLNTLWNKSATKDEFWYIDYKLKLETTWIDGSSMDSCYQFIDKDINNIYKLPPDQMLQSWSSRAKKLLQTPLSVYGVSLPEDATINLYATQITINLVTLTRALQIILLPVLLLWLGSLYSTRYRESLTTGQATSLSEVFPHIINMYPAFNMQSPKKRSFLAPYVKPTVCFLYATVRVCLLSIFILPPVLIYLYSLYLVATDQTSLLYFLAGIVVALFAFTTIVAEFLPMHYSKVFPDPRMHG